MPIFANLGFVLLNGEVSEWHSPFAVKIGYTIYIMLTIFCSNLPYRCLRGRFAIFENRKNDCCVHYSKN